MSDRSAQYDSPKRDPIELYLDGLMTPAERSAFEERMDADEGLAEAVRLQGDIDGALDRLFACPSADDLVARVGAGSSVTAHSAPPAGSEFGSFRVGRIPAMAAMVAIVCVGVWQFGIFPPSGQEGGAGPSTASVGRFDVAYRETDIGGRHPVWVCKDDAEFIGTFEERFGQGLVLGALTEPVRALGLSYSELISKETVVLLGEVGDDLVMVFIDRADRDPGFRAAPNSRLRYHRAEVGKLVLYEVTPLDEPLLLGHFRAASLP